jgi:AcrR family transcriptional regulator
MMSMATPAPRNPRRSDALSRERIVEATIEILDTAGEGGLTVRAVTARLSTGRGAIYHHVTNKDELVAAAADGVIGRAVAEAAGDDDPGRTIRALALAIFDAFVAHPWVRTQLSREPSQPAVQQIWRGLGLQLHRLGIVGTALSDAGSALANYVLGASAQYAAGALSNAAGALSPMADAARKENVEALTAQWTRPEDGPLVEALLGERDDREQFLAGVDIFLAGIASRSSGDS